MHGAVVLTLGSGLAWAGFDLTRKHVARDIDPVPLVAVLSLAQVPFFVAVALLAHHPRAIDAGYWVPGACSIGLSVTGNLLFVKALRAAPASVVLPLLSLTPVLSGLAAAVVLNERPGAWQIAGSVLVVAGAVTMAMLREAPKAGTIKSPSVAAATLLMVVVAVVWSLLGVADKQCLAHAPVGLHGAIRSAGVTSALMTVLLVGRRGASGLAAVVRRRRSILFASLVACLAMFLELSALGTVMVGIQESVKRAIGTFASFAVGRLVFGESVTAPKVLAASVLTLGVVLLQVMNG